MSIHYRPTIHRNIPAFLACLLVLLMAGCSVMFVTPYDEILDKQVTDLQLKTEQFFAKVEGSGASYEASKPFYQDAKAAVRVMRARAEASGEEKNKGEISEINLLEEKFGQLEVYHRAGSIRGKGGQAVHESIAVNFRALLRIELAKKRHFSPPAKSGS